ncbi:MAG: DNRLRE domain-containing protein [Deltaproteobacteria bacterium]|nr:DNRLRE domain-containing protein [Deltaproteobacteria bacterium]
MDTRTRTIPTIAWGVALVWASLGPDPREARACDEVPAPPGTVYICDPLDGTTVSTEHSGTLTAEGLVVDGRRDYLLYDWGVQLADFCIEYEMRGVERAKLDCVGCGGDNHILEVLEEGDLDWHDHCGLGLRIYGCNPDDGSDPTAWDYDDCIAEDWPGRMKLKAWCGLDGCPTCVAEHQTREALRWQVDRWYRIRVVSRGGVFSYSRDGEDILTIDGSSFAPHYSRAFIPKGPVSPFTLLPGTTYRNVMITCDPDCTVPDGECGIRPCTAPDPEGIVVAEDHSVYSAEPDTHGADARSLDVQGETPGSPLEASYLKFVVEPPPGHRVVSAIVHLLCGCPGGPAGAEGGGGAIYFVPDNDWSEAAITWNNRPLPSGEPLDMQGHIDPGLWYEFDVSAAVSGAGTYSFAVLSDDANGGHYLSKEGGAATCQQPYLTVTTAPDSGEDAGEPGLDAGGEDVSLLPDGDAAAPPDNGGVADGGDAVRDIAPAVVPADETPIGCACGVAAGRGTEPAGLAALAALLLARRRRPGAAQPRT